MDWKKTLNLPNTSFSMRANLTIKEPLVLQKWNEVYYLNLLKFWQKRSPFVLCDGPIYANGDIHIGHALNKVLKDIICRSKALDNFCVKFQPGYDCHGLPIELYVANKYGNKNEDKASWNKKCRKHAIEESKKQQSQFYRLGILADWAHSYKTLDFSFEANILSIFQTIYQNGFITRKRKPIHVCLECQSTLSQAEIIYQNKDSETFYFSFYVPFLQAKLLIWTSTPWTISENKAIGINKDFTYCLVDSAIGLIYCTENCLAQIKISSPIIKYIKGSQLLDHYAIHPLTQVHTPIIHSDHIRLDEGTGIVHLAPSHGLEDYEVCQLHNIRAENQISYNGYYLNGIFKGKHIFDINKLISEELKKTDSLLRVHSINHSFPHCWRHKTPLIILNTTQWFINLTDNQLKEKIIAQLSEIQNESSRHLLSQMIYKRPDWCISRNRSWGVPIPIFLHKETEEIHPETNQLIEKIINFIRENGIDNVFTKDNFAQFNLENYHPLSQILDVWFDSGSVILATDQRYPVDLIIEGVDQYRGWFQSLLIVSFLVTGHLPYKNLLSHGFVIDKDMEKMSKSKGNVISPNSLVQSHGADILRLWIASADYTKDIIYSEEIINHCTTDYRKIRNTIRFLLSTQSHFEINQHLHLDQLLLIDKWIISIMKKVHQDIIQHYRNYNFHLIVKNIIYFCSDEMSSIYIEVIRDRLYTSPKESIGYLSTQTTAYHLLRFFISALTPILPFTMDEVTQYIAGHLEIMHQLWYELDISLSREESQVMDLLIELKKLLQKKLSVEGYTTSSEVEIELILSNDSYHLMKKYEKELRFFFLVAKVTLKQSSDHTTNAIGLLKKSNMFKCQRCWNLYDQLNEEKICSNCQLDLNNIDNSRNYF
jgi:isoleucyl-tRNA synthetase